MDLTFNPFAFRMDKTLWSFGRSGCKRINRGRNDNIALEEPKLKIAEFVNLKGPIEGASSP